MPVTTILFDLDDTLLIEHASVEHALCAAARAAADRYECDVATVASLARQHAASMWWASPTHPLCHELGISAMEGLCSTRPGWHRDLSKLQSWLPTYQEAVWREVLRDLRIDDPDLACELRDIYRIHRRRHHSLIQESDRVLSELSSYFKVGLVTNGPADLQFDKLKHTGLSAFSQAVAISGDLRVGKPCTDVFGVALRQLGSAPHETLMVGDNPLRDVLGAVRSGIRPIWINPSNRPLPQQAGHCPITEIESVMDLPALIEKL